MARRRYSTPHPTLIGTPLETQADFTHLPLEDGYLAVAQVWPAKAHAPVFGFARSRTARGAQRAINAATLRVAEQMAVRKVEDLRQGAH